MNYITKWYNDILSRSSVSLQRSVRVRGLRDAHLGPRLEYAAIEVLAEPSTSFEVRFEADIEQGEVEPLFLDAAVLGLLDVLLVSEPYLPFRDVRITISGIHSDPVSSSQTAFRHAGRDAATKIVAAQQS